LRTERRRFFLATLAASVLLAVPSLVFAQAVNKAAAEVPMLDPWVPPSVREKAAAGVQPAATEGDALREQVRAKLRRRFDAAAGPAGTLTREQARSAGLGAIADQFDAIDGARRGAIRFQDYERFLELRR
jgi:hypothetical protein